MPTIPYSLRAWSQSISPPINNEDGATATEYGILTGFIAFVVVAGVGAFGTALNLYFGELGTGIRNALGLP